MVYVLTWSVDDEGGAWLWRHRVTISAVHNRQLHQLHLLQLVLAVRLHQTRVVREFRQKDTSDGVPPQKMPLSQGDQGVHLIIPWANRVYIPNGISISSAILAQLTQLKLRADRQTDRQTTEQQ